MNVSKCGPRISNCSAGPRAGHAPAGAAISTSVSSRRSRFKRLLLWVIAGLALLIGLGIAGLVFRDPLLRMWVERRLAAATGCPSEIGRLHTSLSEGTLELRHVRLRNPPGFGDRVLLDLPVLRFEIDPEASVSRQWRLRRLVVHLAEFNVVRGADGRLNLDALLARLQAQAARGANHGFHRNAEGRASGFAGIGELHLTLGTLRFIDLRHPERNRELPLGVRDEVLRNVRTEEDLRRWYYARLFRVLLEAVLIKPRDGDLLEVLLRFSG